MLRQRRRRKLRKRRRLFRDRARATTSVVAEKVNQEVKSVKDKTSRNWNAL